MQAVEAGHHKKRHPKQTFNRFAFVDVLRCEFEAFVIDVHDQFDPELVFHVGVAKRDHLMEFPGCIDVEERKGRFAWVKGFECKVGHDGRIFTDGVKHDGLFEFGGHFADDVDAFRFELF